MIKSKVLFLRKVIKGKLLLCSAVITPAVDINVNESSKPSQDEKQEPTGWDRLRLMYRRDEFGHYSQEINAVLQTSFLSFFVGACYGGFMTSKNAYFDFIDRNQATVFENHLDAKRKLQNHVTVNFGRGAFRWGWRLALFCGSFQLFLTTLATYRGGTKLMDYVGSGLIAGAAYKVQLGPPGMIVGGTVGSILGLLAGAMTQTLLSLTDTSYDEVIQWQNKMDDYRLKDLRSADLKYQENIIKETLPLLKLHDSNLNVEGIDLKPNSDIKETK